MMNRNNDRRLRFGLLPTALLLLAGIAGVASVGQADEIAPLEAAPGNPVQATDKARLDAAIQADARDAAWLTRINVAVDLDARLQEQHRPFRLASLEPGRRG
jgi:hypothetical protein